MTAPARRRLAASGVLLALMPALAACAARADALAEPGLSPGFWLGLWHGFICPITFLVSLFNDHVGIYEVRNNGHLYDLGFVVGAVLVASVFHGPAHARRRRRRGE
ncbi:MULTISPECIES: hypothetical protein [Amycolatopsis]|uniref:Uncharacterized protein n=1 Tax=Amycolatopsis dendrobii TaxID=2760662 RepID=A0A7W3ZFD6_9PSEU|nr:MULTISPECIES: hypothetical protein [Amycolatopsis]MBB1159521.1 hypothetical protein [Amycolatopsis dendrobii]UKD57396.1 hypothetical protein L3Q65_11930 [Amycolatopsis sp. FU40]